MSWPKITELMAAFAARTWAAVDSAARTIISSSFSRLSPLADAMMSGPFIARLHVQPVAMQQTHQTGLDAPFGPNLPQSTAKLTLSSAACRVESQNCEQACGGLNNVGKQWRRQ